MKKKALSILFLGLAPIALTGCESVEANIFSPVEDVEAEKIDLKKEVLLEHYNGGKYGITFKKIKKTDKRNSYASEEIQDVVVIDYEIQNYNVNESISLYEGIDFKVFDFNNNQLSSYPLSQSIKYASPALVGDISSATIAIGSNNILDGINIVIYNEGKPVNYIKHEFTN